MTGGPFSCFLTMVLLLRYSGLRGWLSVTPTPTPRILRFFNFIYHSRYYWNDKLRLETNPIFITFKQKDSTFTHRRPLDFIHVLTKITTSRSTTSYRIGTTSGWTDGSFCLVIHVPLVSCTPDNPPSVSPDTSTFFPRDQGLWVYDPPCVPSFVLTRIRD